MHSSGECGIEASTSTSRRRVDLIDSNSDGDSIDTGSDSDTASDIDAVDAVDESHENESDPGDSDVVESDACSSDDEANDDIDTSIADTSFADTSNDGLRSLWHYQICVRSCTSKMPRLPMQPLTNSERTTSIFHGIPRVLLLPSRKDQLDAM